MNKSFDLLSTLGATLGGELYAWRCCLFQTARLAGPPSVLYTGENADYTCHVFAYGNEKVKLNTV